MNTTVMWRVVVGLALLVTVVACERAGDGGERAAERASALGDEAAERASALVDEAPSRAGALLREQSAAVQGSVEALLLGGGGGRALPALVEVARVLDEAYQSDTRVEPIVQPIGDGAAGGAAADVAIAGMPRVEVIDGVTVGFKDLAQTDTGGRTTERGVLVTWRRGDQLVGLVYHSQSRIDVAHVVTEAPRLLTLVGGVLEGN